MTAAAVALIIAFSSMPAFAAEATPVPKSAVIFDPARRAVGFRTMETIYPFHEIKRGGAVAELPRAPRALDVTYSSGGSQHNLDDLLARSRTQGFLVISDGKIVDERYFNGADEKSRFTSWSVGKSFTSTLV